MRRPAHLHDALEQVAVAGREQIRRSRRVARVGVVAHAAYSEVNQRYV
ncbi:hypothetical protein BMA2475 [Burkholderia mallei ATCC 23344]|uniref:Uncharacterized protein n=1 Tax=Burkholderia mallei (strain ATCC 23344) TaxID=243160 RepID=A0A0H2WKP9_BURMA|nr:hypothetical protein BMA2475 [Burkholderia mallei ATCC 23344]